MSVFGTFFRSQERSEVALLVDIAADSIAAAYVRYVAAELPTILYAVRLPIEKRDDASHNECMLRGLQALVVTLTSEGSAALVRIAGNSRVENLFVSIDAPWQETQVHTEELFDEKGFVFTKRTVADTIEKAVPKVPGKLFSDASIIATVLDGYRTHDPYDKRVHRASLIFLTSALDEQIAGRIRTALEQLSSANPLALIAGTSVRYQAVQVAFPHEHDALILDATSTVPTLALMRGDLLVAVAETPEHVLQSGAPDDAFLYGFTEIARQYPLPQLIFLLARDSDVPTFEKTIAGLNVSKLWFSNTPPTITAVLVSHLSGLVRQMSMVPPDLPLLLMAIYYGHRAETLWGNAH